MAINSKTSRVVIGDRSNMDDTLAAMLVTTSVGGLDTINNAVASRLSSDELTHIAAKQSDNPT